MKTASGMIIQRTANESWPEGILWPVVRRTLAKGWRSGRTRTYTLKCGHYYNSPASRSDNK